MKKEIKVGEIVEIDGVRVQCVEQVEPIDNIFEICDICYQKSFFNCNQICCRHYQRKDRKNVYFKKLEP